LERGQLKITVPVLSASNAAAKSGGEMERDVLTGLYKPHFTNLFAGGLRKMLFAVGYQVTLGLNHS
jgi:hypothetical protein